MVTYIYFVKCPNCEDEHFDFFDEAKEFALGCLSQKPIITQTEVCRNDFGECTDHSDLGTVWSWEEAMKDTEGGYTDAEPTKSVFTKDDLKQMADGQDPEFDDDDFYFNNGLVEDVATRISFKNNTDREEFFRLCREIGIITGEDLKHFMADTEADDSNLLDKLRAYRDGLGTDFTFTECIERKPIPEGMTIEQLVEAMQENEDTVECAGCEELFSKDECFHKEGIGYLCGDCEDRIVKCTWCKELYDKSECRWETGFKDWLCSRCEAAIKSRGETLTFKEGNYWDFLDEELKPKTWICEFDGREIGTVVASIEEEAYEAMEREYPEYHYGLYDGVGIVYPADDEDLTENLNEELSFSDMVADSIKHLTNDLGKDPMSDDFADLVIKDIEDNYDVDFPDNPEDYRAWASEVASEVSRQLNNQLDEKLDIDIDFSQVIDSSDMEIWGIEPISENIYKAVLLKRFENVPFRGGCDEIEKVEDEMFDLGGLFVFHFGKDGLPKLGRWDPKLLNSLGNCEIVFDDARYDQAVEETLNGSASKRETLDPEYVHDLGNEYDGGYPTETPEVSDSHLKLCPECGKETFDSETGICVACGTNYLAEALTDNDINDILQAVKLANKTIEDKIDDATTDIKKLVVQHHELVGKGLDQEFKKTSDKLDQILQK